MEAPHPLSQKMQEVLDTTALVLTCPLGQHTDPFRTLTPHQPVSHFLSPNSHVISFFLPPSISFLFAPSSFYPHLILSDYLPCWSPRDCYKGWYLYPLSLFPLPLLIFTLFPIDLAKVLPWLTGSFISADFLHAAYLSPWWLRQQVPLKCW
jgi:hypothetical protein